MPNGKQDTKPTEVQAPDQETQFLAYLDKEITELESRESRLEHLRSIRAAMTGQKVTVVQGGRSTGTRRGRQGDRLGQFLGLVTSKPGITIAEAAKEMGIQPNYLYRLKGKAEQAGQIRAEGGGIFPVEQAQEPVAA